MGGKGGGLLNRLIISPLVFLAVFFTCAFFVLGPRSTAAFATTVTTAFGYGIGITVGSLPNLFENVKNGQAATGGSGQAAPAPSTSPQPRGSGGTGTKAKPTPSPTPSPN